MIRPPSRRLEPVAHGQVWEVTFDFPIFQSADLEVSSDASRHKGGIAPWL
jgi:hypothetical protein